MTTYRRCSLRRRTRSSTDFVTEAEPSKAINDEKRLMNSSFTAPSSTNCIDNTGYVLIDSSAQSTTLAIGGVAGCSSKGQHEKDLHEQDLMTVHKTKCRIVQSWNDRCITLFFQALKMYGKDFDGIRTYMASKCTAQQKSVAQIRNFYRNTSCRLMSKVNQLTFADPGHKELKELLIMVAYSELRKRAPQLKTTSKNFPLILSTLVLNGYTVVHIKWKTKDGGLVSKKQGRYVRVRIKMPFSPALARYVRSSNCRRFDNNSSISDVLSDSDIQLPKLFTLVLIPDTFNDQRYVNSICFQNPQISFENLSFDHTFDEIISFLQSKWTPNRGFVEDDSDSNKIEQQPQITLYPHEDHMLRSVRIEPKTTDGSLPSCFGLKYWLSMLHKLNDHETNESKDSKKLDNQEVDYSTDLCILKPDCIINGICLGKSQAINVGHFSLMVSGLETLKFRYRIQHDSLKDNDLKSSPLWSCLLNLIRHDFVDILNQKLGKKTSDRCETDENELSHSNWDENHIKKYDHFKLKSKPTILPKLSSSEPSMTSLARSQIVTSENEKFIDQFCQIRRNVVQRSKQQPALKKTKTFLPRNAFNKRFSLVSTNSNVPFKVQSSSTSSVVSNDNNNVTSNGLKSAFKPIVKTPVRSIVSFGGDIVANNRNDSTHLSTLNGDNSKMNNNLPSNLWSKVSLQNNGPLFDSTENDKVDVVSTTARQDFQLLTSVNDLSLDSIKSFGSFAAGDSNLQNHMKQSVDMLLSQNSLDFCRSFEDLAADVLVTPQKSRQT